MPLINSRIGPFERASIMALENHFRLISSPTIENVCIAAVHPYRRQLTFARWRDGGSTARPVQDFVDELGDACA
jgi:hypothetical protein